MSKIRVSVDFDGVIHSYRSPWNGPSIIPDPPVPGAIRWIIENVNRYELYIFSSRSEYLEGVQAMQSYIWSNVASLESEEIADSVIRGLQFPTSKPSATITIDDRAVTFQGDWSVFTPEFIESFQPWNRR